MDKLIRILILHLVLIDLSRQRSDAPSRVCARLHVFGDAQAHGLLVEGVGCAEAGDLEAGVEEGVLGEEAGGVFILA